MFRATTRGIAVTVTPDYLPQESNPDGSHYVWAYHVRIENGGPVTVQLLSRRWLITDGHGMTREVAGRGVVGLQPVIQPGREFEYTSGCPLSTPTGFMVGQYRMVTDTGEIFDVEIPAFALDLPDTDRTLN